MPCLTELGLSQVWLCDHNSAALCTFGLAEGRQVWQVKLAPQGPVSKWRVGAQVLRGGAAAVQLRGGHVPRLCEPAQGQRGQRCAAGAAVAPEALYHPCCKPSKVMPTRASIRIQSIVHMVPGWFNHQTLLHECRHIYY